MTTKTETAQGGFTLIELMIVMVLLAIVTGSVFLQVQTAHQRGATERVQLDLFQESREFMDQISRDLRQVGYPNPRNFNAGILNPTVGGITQDPTTSTLAAVGLVKVDDQHLWFQGGLDDNGQVLYTQYTFDPSTTNGCPCLKRSQQQRPANPNTDTAQYNAEVQNVQNYADPDPSKQVPIFTYYKAGGSTPATVPLTWPSSTPLVWGTDYEALADVDTIQIQLIVKAPNGFVDLKTGQAPVIRLVSTVRVNNCVQFTTGQLSCAN
jgi:prepilin-type N-terminal cleavage/methylation domain-containing protein